MALLGPPEGKKKDSGHGKYGAYSMYLVVPGIVVAAPLIGFFAGQWADSKLGTDPYLLIVGLFFGIGAAGREIYKLVQKVQAIEEERDDS